MKQYAAWQAPFYSFWSKQFYVDVANNWGGLAYAYLFVLLCFTWLFMSAKMAMDFSYSTDHFMKPVIEQLPVMTIKKGNLSIDHSCPYTVKSTEGESLITFDTRDNPIKAEEAPGVFFVKKSIVLVRPRQLNKQLGVQDNYPPATSPTNPDQNMDLFSTVDDAVVDQKSVYQSISVFKKMCAIAMFFICLPLGFILCLLQSLIYGLIAMAIASANQFSLPYASAVRLSVVTMTPVLLIDSLLKLRNLNSIFWGPIALLITVGYIMFAVRALIDNSNQKSQAINS